MFTFEKLYNDNLKGKDKGKDKGKFKSKGKGKFKGKNKGKGKFKGKNQLRCFAAWQTVWLENSNK